MKRRVGELQLFSMSFLDILSCGLGAVLLLLLISMRRDHATARAYQTQADAMRQQMARASAEVADAQAELADLKQSVASLTRAAAKLEQAKRSLVGLRGRLRHVVFVFDTSASMATVRYKENVEFLKNWVAELPYEQFNIARYSTNVDILAPDQMLTKNDANLARAMAFIDGFRPDGNTNTLDAIKAAFSLPTLDTVVLFSDGAPNQPPDEIRQWTRDNNAAGVIINTVAMGNYFRSEYGEFLQRLAHDTNGMFIGR